MKPVAKIPGVAALAVAAILSAPVQAQFVQVYYPAPAVSFYAPPVYYTPAVSYSYVPTVSYSYYPSTTVFSAPAVYSAPGVVTTRSYYGFGIFRPRGWYTQSYYTPSYVIPATSYYTPVFWR